MKQENNDEKYFTINQICKFFKISKSTFHRRRKKHNFPNPAIKDGRIIRYEKNLIEEWLKQQKN